MKKTFFAILLTATFAISTTAFAEDGQNPVMNFIGRYGENRATIDVSAEGDSDAKIHVSWGSSASQTSEWDMSGTLDMDTLTVEYDNCVKKTISFEDEDSAGTETIEYENGAGSITFAWDGTLTWDDQEEHVADGTVFTYSSYAESDLLSGGWTVAGNALITEDIDALFQQGMDNYETETTVSYTPVIYLGSQVVAGTNHAILCRAQEDNQAPTWSIVYLFEDLDGSVSVLNIEELIL